MSKSSPKFIYVVHIQKNDEWKKKLWTSYGHFKYVVMHFGLPNALIVFQHFMNNIFHEYLDYFMVCYIDDIVNFSNNMKEHEWHVQLVLDKFREVELYVKLKKCEFY
jgi:hypothetical protein